MWTHYGNEYMCVWIGGIVRKRIFYGRSNGEKEKTLFIVG